MALHINCAPKHVRPFFAVLWNTGRRHSEILYVSRRFPDYTDRNGTGLNLEPGREHIYLGRTKNGKPRIVFLNDSAVAEIESWLESREDDFDALFLTHRLVPYKRTKKGRGGQTRTAWKITCAAAAKIIEEEWKLPERAKVMRQATPHWARHNMTSHLLASGEDDERVRDFMGWSSKAMVERYGWDLPEAGKKRANIVQFGTKLTRGPTGKKINNGDSIA